MRRDASEYQYVIVETVKDTIRNKVIARPVEGEAFPTTMHVECSKDIRNKHPLGTRFRIKALVKQPKSLEDRPHLYSSYKFPYDIVS